MRINVYIPEDLKKRMDKIAKRDEVNWSAIACRAFAEQCSQFESRRESVKNMKEVIERMKGLAHAESSEAEAKGHAAGIEWAKQSATPKQLKALAKARDPQRDWCFDVCDGEHNPTAAEAFVRAINGREDVDNNDVLSFWESQLGDDNTPTDDPDFVHAFAMGAMEVWDEVSKHL